MLVYDYLLYNILNKSNNQEVQQDIWGKVYLYGLYKLTIPELNGIVVFIFYPQFAQSLTPDPVQIFAELL